MRNGTIIYIGGFELPDKNAAAHRVISNGKLLNKLGYNVVYMGVSKEMKNNRMIRKQVQGFDSWIVKYPKSMFEWFEFLKSSNNFLEVVKCYTDIKMVICYNHHAIPLYKIKKYCNNNSIKIIADCTEWYGTKGFNLIFNSVKGLDTFIRMRVIHHKLDGLIVISEYLKEYYKASSNLLYLPPLVDKYEEKWDVDNHETNDGEIKFVYAGSVGRDKDKLNYIIDVFEEFSEFDNFVVTIVGLSLEEYISSKKKFLKTSNSKIKFLGRVEHNESLQHVNKADYSLFIREANRMTNAGFPTKFVESISCGTPVITTNTSNINQYIQEGVNGVVIDLKSKENITVQLEKIIKNILTRNLRISKNVLNSDQFHFSNYEKQMNSFIKKLFTD